MDDVDFSGILHNIFTSHGTVVVDSEGKRVKGGELKLIFDEMCVVKIGRKYYNDTALYYVDLKRPKLIVGSRVASSMSRKHVEKSISSVIKQYGIIYGEYKQNDGGNVMVHSLWYKDGEIVYLTFSLMHIGLQLPEVETEGGYESWMM